MKHTIQAQFEEQIKFQGTSTFMAFVRAIKGRGFDRYLIGRWFDKLVDRDDYELRDRDRIVEQLSRLSNVAQLSQSKNKNRQPEEKTVK